MKKLSTLALALLLSFGAFAQEPSADAELMLDNRYEFSVVKDIETTPVRDQNRSGTCWSFSGVGLIESELIRQGKGEYDLSEMWIVRQTYIDKAVKFVRMHGNMEFAAGGSFEDVFSVAKKYGLVPEEAYPGLNYGLDNHDHSELDAVLRAYVDAIVKPARGKKLTTAWLNGLKGILDAYFGPAPEQFTYNGRQYTPESFRDMLGLQLDDYVSISSFTHHPYYTEFVIEVPDNWIGAASWNLPLEEMMAVIDNAIDTGYTIAWGADVSESGFLYRKGYAVVPAEQEETLEGTELSRWVALSPESRMLELLEENGELRVTPEIRQLAYDNYETTDDHGMLITGVATDQRGDTFYRVKNSWTSNGIYDGYFYASRPFVEYKTLNIVVHKDAIPAAIRAKIGL